MYLETFLIQFWRRFKRFRSPNRISCFPKILFIIEFADGVERVCVHAAVRL